MGWQTQSRVLCFLGLGSWHVNYNLALNRAIQTHKCGCQLKSHPVSSGERGGALKSYSRRTYFLSGKTWTFSYQILYTNGPSILKHASSPYPCNTMPCSTRGHMQQWFFPMPMPQDRYSLFLQIWIYILIKAFVTVSLCCKFLYLPV